MTSSRIHQQMQFAVTIDALKQVERRTLIQGGSRHENDAEHSWHIATMAILLKEYAEPADLDIDRVVRMLLIHDLVEIGAGDTFCYDEVGKQDQAERERAAADSLFSQLPEDQTRVFRELWDEFEERRTPEARFAQAIDRIQPLLNNLGTGGHSWKKHGIRAAQVVERIAPAKESAPALYAYACELIEDAVEQGLLIR